MKKPTLLSRIAGAIVGFGFFVSIYLAWALLWVAVLWLVIAVFSLSQ